MILSRRIARRFSQNLRCIIVHPVAYPNQGPITEQYLAEEALGLAKSLGWYVLPGPYWDNTKKRPITPIPMKANHLYIEADPQELQDGDYVKTNIGSGTIYGDGMLFDQESEQSDDQLYKQWRDKITRQSLANSSLVKVRHITRKTFFTKGKLHYLTDYLKQTPFDCLFINAELRPTQLKNLRKFVEARINDLSVASAYPSKDPFDSETDFQTEDSSPLVTRRNQPEYKRIHVFDRFSIILQIFAARTTSRLAKLQVELSFLNYLRTRLVREGNTYLSTIGSFTPDLLANTETAMEVISAKQRKAARTMGGEGQSQLQLERRKLRDRQAEIRRQIEEQSRLRMINMEKRERRGSILPVVALVGYTNVGKSALMNAFMKKNEVQSKDLLFQTLHTTTRSIVLPSGSRVSLLDTIGFITNLPVEMVECFKSTLQEIAHADLVIHMRDCHHPHHVLQKHSVLTILEEMGFGKAFQEERMLQVWNKVDLLSEEKPQGICISCLTGQGLHSLAEQIQQKLMKIKGQSLKQIQYGLQHHADVLQWVKKNTSHSYNIETEYNYQPSREHPQGSVKIYLNLDQKETQRLNSFLNPEKKKDKSKRGMPPKEGW